MQKVDVFSLDTWYEAYNVCMTSAADNELLETQ
jgi:hypothetical protein